MLSNTIHTTLLLKLQTRAAMEENQEDQSKLRFLEALKRASEDLKAIPIPLYSTTNMDAIKALLELETRLQSVLSSSTESSTLFNLSVSLMDLKNQFNKLQSSQDNGLRSFIRRQFTNYKISAIAGTIEAQVRALIGRERIKRFVKVLQESGDEEERVRALMNFEELLASGFDRDFQESILKAQVFPVLESVLCKPECSIRVREQCAFVTLALVRFNKDVFVGQVLMGPTIPALVSMNSSSSIQVLSSLMKLIGRLSVLKMEENGYIMRITSLLNSENASIQAAAVECVLELAYLARKETLEAMLEDGLIKKLVELERTETNGDHQNGENCAEPEAGTGAGEGGFRGCVTRLVVQVEMGEGLEAREKRELKQEMLRRVKEASVSDAEYTCIVAEVLWGSSPL